MPDFTAMLWVSHQVYPDHSTAAHGQLHIPWPAPCPLILRACSGPCAPLASGLCGQEAPGTVAPGSSLQVPFWLLGASAVLLSGRVTPRHVFCSGSQQCPAGCSSRCPHAFLISISHPLLAFPKVISRGNHLGLTDVSLHDETFTYHVTL